MVKFLEKMVRKIVGLFQAQPVLVKASQKTSFKNITSDYANRDEINRRWK